MRSLREPRTDAMLTAVIVGYALLAIGALLLYALVPTLAHRSGRSWILWSVLTLALTPIVAGLLLEILNHARKRRD